jgi:hypothetical protein
VTIRRRLPEGGYADWVGALERAAPEEVAVRHRSGALRSFAASEIAIAHLVEGRPPRRAGPPPAGLAPGQPKPGETGPPQ